MAEEKSLKDEQFREESMRSGNSRRKRALRKGNFGKNEVV